MTITTERLDELEAAATNQPLIPSYSGMLGDEGVKDVLLDLIAEVRRLQWLSDRWRCSACGAWATDGCESDCPFEVRND